MSDRPTGTIRHYQDGDVWRIGDEAGRRYYYCPRDSNAAFWAEERFADSVAWNKYTAFTEREAKLLLDALSREQRTAAELDRITGDIAAFEDAITAAKAWRSRRQDG